MRFKEIPCAVVDVFEPIGAEVDAAIPTRHNNYDIARVHYLPGKNNTKRWLSGDTAATWRKQQELRQKAVYYFHPKLTRY